MDAAVRRMTSKKSSKTPDIAKASAKPNDTLERGACCDDHGPGDRNSAVEPEPAECTKRLRDNAWRVKDRPGAKRARAVAWMSSFVERHYKEKGIPWPIRPPPRENVETVEDECLYNEDDMNEQVDTNKDMSDGEGDGSGQGDTCSSISCKTRPMPSRGAMGKPCGGKISQIPVDSRSLGARSSVGFGSQSIVMDSDGVELYSRLEHQQQQQHQTQSRGFDTVALPRSRYHNDLLSMVNISGFSAVRSPFPS